MYIKINICICMCVCVCVCVCVYTYIHTYIHTHICELDFFWSMVTYTDKGADKVL